MITAVLDISQFIINAFLHIWPYLLATIPLAFAVPMSGASKYIKRAFEARPRWWLNSWPWLFFYRL